MLYDVKKRKEIRGAFDLARYDSAMLSKMVRRPLKSDGVTNSFGVNIVKRINEDLDAACALQVKLAVVRTMIADMASEGIPANDVLARYKQCANTFGAHRSVIGIWKTLTSLREQRNFFRAVKNEVKKNKLSKDWFELIGGQLSKFEERLSRLETVQIRALSAPTPLKVYLRVLSEKGVTFADEVSRYGIDSSFFENIENDERFKTFYGHVLTVISENIREDELEEIVGESVKSAEAHAMQKQAIARQKAEEEAERFRKMADMTEEVVFAFCNRAKGVMRKERATALNRMAEHCSTVYVAVAAIVPKRGANIVPRYVMMHKGGQPGMTALYKSAKLFKSEAEAKAALKTLAEAHPENEYISAISEIKLYDYINHAV